MLLGQRDPRHDERDAAGACAPGKDAKHSACCQMKTAICFRPLRSFLGNTNIRGHMQVIVAVSDYNINLNNYGASVKKVLKCSCLDKLLNSMWKLYTVCLWFMLWRINQANVRAVVLFLKERFVFLHIKPYNRDIYDTRIIYNVEVHGHIMCFSHWKKLF